MNIGIQAAWGVRKVGAKYYIPSIHFLYLEHIASLYDKVYLISNVSIDTEVSNKFTLVECNNVEFVSIVPVKYMKYNDNTKEKNNDEANNIKITDPLLIKESKKYLIELTFNTGFVNLISFLRELEFMESVILINKMNLKLLSQNSNNGEINNPTEKIEVKLSTTFYGRP